MTLRSRELTAVDAELAAGMGFQQVKAQAGDYLSGTLRRQFTLTTGRFAMIEGIGPDGVCGFQLMPWSRHIVTGSASASRMLRSSAGASTVCRGASATSASDERNARIRPFRGRHPGRGGEIDSATDACPCFGLSSCRRRRVGHRLLRPCGTRQHRAAGQSV